MNRILSINPGSTSTKFACFEDDKSVFEQSIPFSEEERAAFATELDQLDRRFELISEAMKAAALPPGGFDAVVGRGGLLAPIPSGTYAVNGEMERDLREAKRGTHASNLGGLLALRFASLSLSCLHRGPGLGRRTFGCGQDLRRARDRTHEPGPRAEPEGGGAQGRR